MTDEEGERESTGSETPVPSPAQPAIEPEILELDHVFSTLGHPRRRYVMYALAGSPDWTLTELATKLAAWEQDIDEDLVDESTRDSMYVSLYHAHVPKLDDEGVVHFDEDTETIARADHAEQIFAILEGAGTSTDAAQEQHAHREYDGDDGHERS